MRIPWIPQEQGGGSHGPTLAERIFVGANGQADYGTAMNPVGRKAFMNLPMPTKDAMNIYEPNLHNGPKKGARGMIGSGLRHNHPQGAGENYVDSFVTHPIAGNYEKLFAVLDEQKKEEEVERVPSLTLEMVAQQGYTNMGLNADEERMNSLRDRLRFMGASDEEIETQLKEARQERVRAMAGRAMIPEAHQLFEADKWARQMSILAREPTILGLLFSMMETYSTLELLPLLIMRVIRLVRARIILSLLLRLVMGFILLKFYLLRKR